MKFVYGEMAADLRALDQFREEMKVKMIVPSEVLAAEKHEQSIKFHLLDMIPLIRLHARTLERRLVEIEKDKLLKRRAELRHEEVRPAKRAQFSSKV